MSDIVAALRELARSHPASTAITAADAIESLESKNAALIAERDALRTALRRYGAHASNCGTQQRDQDGSYAGFPCTCGLSALLLSAEQERNA
jgi:hypothetical protein